MKGLLLLALLLASCTAERVRITTVAEGRDYDTRPRPLRPAKCQQRVRLPKP
jgi:hypothetical protein